MFAAIDFPDLPAD